MSKKLYDDYLNNNRLPKDKYHGTFYMTLLIGLTYACLTSCRAIKDDIKSRQEYNQNQREISDLVRTNQVRR